MDRRTPNPPHSVSYGQACKQCFQAKTRCISVSRNDTRGCERCTRLKKPCQPSDSVRKRGAQKNQEPNSQIKKLEGRIDGLMEVVQSVAQSAGVEADVQRALGEGGVSLASPLTNSEGGSRTDQRHGQGQGQGPTPLTGLSPETARDYSPVDGDGLFQHGLRECELEDGEAERCLELFRSRMLPCFPFMDLPSSATAKKLRGERPFLLKAIVTVTSVSTDQKAARAEELRGFLAKSVVVENQSNIDLLLGLLTYLTWNTEPFLSRGCSLSHLVMMAVSLVYDLRLAKRVAYDAQVMTVMTRRGEGDVDGIPTNSHTEGFLEQQRAVLACFLLSSVISFHFGLIEALQWTSQMEEALHIIAANKACPTDESFAFQVGLQLLAQKTTQAREYADQKQTRAATDAPTASLSTLLYLNTLQERLKELRSSVSQEVLQQDIPTAYAHYVELCITDAAQPACSDALLLPTTGPSSYGGTALDFERFQCRWRCVEAIKSWLDVLYRIPPAAFVGFPFFFWSQMVRCIMILKHLSILEDPAWDCQAVRNTIDLLRVLDWMIEKVELASVEVGESSDNDLFRQFPRMLRMSRAWVGARWKAAPFAVEQHGSLPTSEGMAGIDYDMADPDQMAWLRSVDLGDDKWFEEWFGGSSMNH